MGRFVFKLPDVGEGIAEAEVVSWHVAVGATVAEDDPLVDVMTDKATVEIPSPRAGRVLAITGGPGDKIRVGAELVVLEVDGDGEAASPGRRRPRRRRLHLRGAEDCRHRQPGGVRCHSGKRPADTRTVGRETIEAPALAPSDRGKAAGLARRTAPCLRAWHSAAIHPRDRAGRPHRPCRSRRLRRLGRHAPRSRPAAGGAGRNEAIEEIKIIGLRRRIAERMQESKRRIPHYSYVEELDVTALEELRAHLNARHAADRPRLTLLPFLIRALVRAVPRFPQVNALFDDEAGIVRRHAALHVGIATQTPQGLMVPVVRHAEALDLWEVGVRDRPAGRRHARRQGRPATN